jgi:hypothetical protein
VKVFAIVVSTDSFSPPSDFHPAFEAMAEISLFPLAASWAASLFNQAVLVSRLP